MKVCAHALPEPRTMVGGLAAGHSRGELWVSVGGSSTLLWRFDPDRGGFEPEPAGGHLRGCSYIHRSLVVAADGSLYVAANRLPSLWPQPGRRMSARALPPRLFQAGLRLLMTAQKIGERISSSRIVRRHADGHWERYADVRMFSIDLAWDASRGQILRLSPKGVTVPEPSGTESTLLPSAKGFVHELAVGPGGELVTSDANGIVFVADAKGTRVQVGNIEDLGSDRRAAPGIDGLLFVPPGLLVGGTRNRARPFVLDLNDRRLHLLEPLSVAPRASAFCSTPAGRVFFVAGVGRAVLYELDVMQRRVRECAALEANGIVCHHIHDLVSLPDGRLFAGEFFPLDVTEPPWPSRDCMLWEIRLGE
ncbi:MAG: hypothetical protein HYY13_10135 [Nitrospirae bacterium]|nr:hypothetical protein [Nitrospirota bacterium]